MAQKQGWRSFVILLKKWPGKKRIASTVQFCEKNGQSHLSHKLLLENASKKWPLCGILSYCLDLFSCLRTTRLIVVCVLHFYLAHNLQIVQYANGPSFQPFDHTTQHTHCTVLDISHTFIPVIPFDPNLVMF